MDNYVLKLQEDLRTKFDRLCWMHNEPALHVTEHFAELRRQVDLDAEHLLSEIQSVKRETGKARKDSDVNGTRLEFIRILEEIEKRTGYKPKPQTPASEMYASLEQRFNAFKDSSSSLDELDDSYVQLAREIIAETRQLEKRILGEQSIIYLSPKKKDHFGSLLYFGDVFLSQCERHHLIGNGGNGGTLCPQSCSDSLLVQASEPKELSKSKQVVESLFFSVNYRLNRRDEESKFFYIGKSEDEYSGYSAEGSSVAREFLSYLDISKHKLLVRGDVGLNMSANLFDVYSSACCKLEIENCRLESLHVNVLPTPATHLVELRLTGVHFESFGTDLIAMCTNLNELSLQATFSKGVIFDLAFLRALTKLKVLVLTLPTSPKDMSAFISLTVLRYLRLEGSSHFYAEKLPSLSNAGLEQIVSLPGLESLEISGFEIENIDCEMLSRCRCLGTVQLTRNQISCVNQDCIANLGFAPSVVKLMHNDSLPLNVRSFAGMADLRELSLTDNSIADLPLGVFHELNFLQRIKLDNNLIRHIRCGVFGKLKILKVLTMDDNPIESIEANAFCELNNLTQLTLQGCRLKSIDSEMFNGLVKLGELKLSSNLIERIEVVTEDGRWVNVAKADLNNEEKQLVEKHLFKDLSSLYSLDLRKNKLKKLDLNCFYNLKCSELYLSSNAINELSGEAGPELLPNLKTLQLEHNRLTNIDKRALPKTLTCLSLSRNKLKSLDEDFFAEFAQLEHLSLSQNELNWTITDATFARCKSNLVGVSLNENESVRWTERAFAQMPSLYRVECDFSEHLTIIPAYSKLRVRRLTPEVIRAIQYRSDMPENLMNHMNAFYSSDGSIKSLIRDPAWKSTPETPETNHFNLSWLSNASRLKELDFSGSLIETLDDPDLFVDFKSITKISLSGNRLSRINRDIFKCLPQLLTIDLSCNQLSSIDMGLFRYQKYLLDLNLSSNNISFLNLARLFRVCPNLRSLNLANNQLDERSTAEPIDARLSYYLHGLCVANNRFEKMEFVRDMIKLQYLDLRGNRIESVMSNGGENMLGRLRELTRLDLSQNQIHSLTDEMFTHLRGQLEYLDLSDNPID